MDIDVTKPLNHAGDHVYVETLVDPSRLEWGTLGEVTKKLRDRLAEDVGEDRADRGTLHQWEQRTPPFGVKVRLVAAPA